MHCIHCGEIMEGDGYTIVYHCPSIEVDGVEPKEGISNLLKTNEE